MIQQCAVAFPGRLEILDQVGELLGVVAFNLFDFLDQFLPVAMMCERVMRVGEAQFGVRP